MSTEITGVHVIEMTLERQKRFNEICSELIDVLKKKTQGPAEAYIVVRQLYEALQETLKDGGLVSVQKHVVDDTNLS